jgi:signal transduction histidine kinase
MAVETEGLVRRIEELEQRADAAESQLLARARFLAEAEHRMKTPLSILGGISLTLRDRGSDLSETTRDALQEGVVRNVARLGQELESLLVEARADIRSRELRPRESDMGAMVGDIAKAFDGLGPAHNVRADVAGEVSAYVDPDAASQVLGHLIDNAMKYSPKGGSIIVRARRLNEIIEIQVIDEGVGLPASVDVFEAFRRGNDATKTPGIGLGLHIVRTLVEAMGGTVSARSNPDSGSTFTVTLPATGSI